MTARTPQHRINSGFDAATTAHQVLDGIDLEGQLAIVTGGYAGVGLETTRALAAAGATIIVAGRSLEKGREALRDIPRVELEMLDLIDPQSVDRFAERFLATGRPLRMLINNAGIMAAPLTRDPRGFESQLATNHIGHFQLTLRLWPALLAAKGARVVALSSRGHVRSGVDFDDPQFERRPYDKWSAYGQSKTANALFAVALDARGQAHGVRAFSAHPGAIATTNLMRSMSEEEQRAAIEVARAGTFKNEEQGAATSVWCATSRQLDGMGGVYCEDVDIAELVPAEDTGLRGVRPWATNPDFAERLWAMSEGWTGLTLPQE